MRTERFAVLAAALGLLLSGAALWGANKNILGLFHDDAIYAVVAKAVAQGDGYRIISLPGAPPQTKYPFLYSYLLSCLWALNPNFPENIPLIKGFNGAVLGGSFIAAAVFYRRIFARSGLGAFAFGLLVCANPIIFTFTDYAVSDLLFVLLALAGLTMCTASWQPVAGRGRELTLAIVAGLACLTRLAAAPLVLAGAVQSFVNLRWRGGVYFLAGVAVVVAPWLVWIYFWAAHPPSSLFSYYLAYDWTGHKTQEFAALAFSHWPVIAGNARYFLSTFDLLYLLPFLPGLWILVCVLTVVGMIVSVGKEQIFLWCFFLSSLALLLIWPFHPVRYMAPLVPVWVLFLFRGAQFLEQRILAFERRRACGKLLGKVAWLPVWLVLLHQGVWLSSYLWMKDGETTRALYGNRLPYAWSGFEESFAWIRQNTRPDSLLATAYDPMYYLYTARRAVRPALHRPATYFYPHREAKPDVGSVDEVKPQLDGLRVDYLIIDPLDGYAEGKVTLQLMQGLVEAYGDKARLVFVSADGKHRIYAIER